jgi:hypothetical protein
MREIKPEGSMSTVEQGKIEQVIILKSKLKLYFGLFHVVLE